MSLLNDNDALVNETVHPRMSINWYRLQPPGSTTRMKRSVIEQQLMACRRRTVTRSSRLVLSFHNVTSRRCHVILYVMRFPVAVWLLLTDFYAQFSGNQLLYAFTHQSLRFHAKTHFGQRRFSSPEPKVWDKISLARGQSSIEPCRHS